VSLHVHGPCFDERFLNNSPIGLEHKKSVHIENFKKMQKRANKAIEGCRTLNDLRKKSFDRAEPCR
jgi:hypothetical protein